jgi:hypothetical protein
VPLEPPHFSHWSYINHSIPGKALHEKQQSEGKSSPPFIHFSMAEGARIAFATD